MDDAVLAQLDIARTALAEAKTIQETKKVLDIAIASQVFAKRQKLGKEAERYALSIRIEALAQLGEMLANTKRANGGRPWPEKITGSDAEPVINKTPTLKDLGLDKKTSMFAQDVARLPPDLFERLKTGEITIPQAKRKVAKRKKERARKELIIQVDDTLLPEACTIYHGDFREVSKQIPDNSIDLIFTDPPYDEKSIPLYEDMAIMAARVLKPGGSLLTYVGHYAILRAGALMENHLRFWWTIALEHSGNSARLPGKWVFIGWKPILWFVKENRHEDNYVYDIFRSKPATKELHEWQQGISEALYYIEHLSPGDGVILDPFAGSGTTLLAAKQLGRYSIGIEKEAHHVSTIKSTLANTP